MTVSRTKLYFIFLFIGFCTFPRFSALPQEAVSPTIPNPTISTQLENNTNSQASETDTSILIDTLQAIDPESIGLLSEANGGFSSDLWLRSNRTQVESLLLQLPTGVRSRAAHQLLKTLILSSGPPPEKKSDSVDFLELRLETLINLGEFESFLELFGKIPDSAITENIRKLKSNLLLLMGDIESACTLVNNQVREGESPYWQKALFICQLMKGEDARAALTLGLLREQNKGVSIDFIELGGLSLGEIPTLSTPPIPNPLNFALLLGTEERIPDHWLVSGGPSIQRAIAESATIPLTTRLIAGENAAEMGVFSADDVGYLYRLMQFNDEELDNAISEAKRVGGPIGRALLYQASRRPQSIEKRASLLVASWRNSLVTGHGLLTAHVNKKALLSLPVNDQIANFAPQVARALLATDNGDIFGLWLKFLNKKATTDDQLQQALDSIMPIVVVANTTDKTLWKPELAKKWWDSIEDIKISDTVDYAKNSERASRLFAVLEALGYNIGPDGWNLLLSGPKVITAKVPNTGVRYGLHRTAQAEQVGETILFSLLALGEGGPAEAGPVALSLVIRCLRHVGVIQNAQAIALEAVIVSKFQ